MPSSTQTVIRMNSIVVIKDDIPALEENLDYSRAFEIPQIPSDVIADWIDQAKDGSLASGHTRRNYQADILNFEAWRRGRQITPKLVRDYLRHRRDETGHELSPTYRRRVLAAIRWWIRCIVSEVQTQPIAPRLWPWKYELLNQLDLTTKFRGPRGQRKEAAQAGRHIEDEEAVALLDACLRDLDELRGARDLAMIAVAIASGPRVHENVGILLKDVADESDATGPAYRINIIGKGDKAGDLLIVGLAAEYLKRWLDLRGNEPGGVFCPIHREGQFRRMPGKNALKPMTTEAARLILAERCRQAGIHKRTTWHDFRRTIVGKLIRHDIGIAQRAARHVTVNQTVKYDRRPDEEVKAALLKEIERLRQLRTQH